jgi:long-chain acyl-CoA synthetase
MKSPEKDPAAKIKIALKGWRAARPEGPLRSRRALDVLAGLEEALARGADHPLDRDTAFRLLGETGKTAFLQSLGDPDRLDRWAEAAFALIRESGFTLLDLFKSRVKAHPAKILFQDMSRAIPLQWTYEQIDRRAREIAAALFGLSSRPGKSPRVAIFSENSVASASLDLACLFYDILDTPLNTHLDPDGLVEILNRLAIDVVAVDSRERLARVEEVGTRVDRPFRVVALDPDVGIGNDRVVFLDAARGELAASEIAGRLAGRRKFALNEVATVMFTSGSTGRPKGVSFSGYQLIAKRFARAASLPSVGEDEVFLSFLPLYHTFGRFLEMLGAIYWGGTYVFPGNPSAETLFTLLPRVNPTGFISVPVRWGQLFERCLEKRDEAGPGGDAGSAMRAVVGRNLRWGLSAAGYLDPRVFHFFEKNGIEISSGFGMTEATGGITMTPPGAYMDDTQGLPLPGIRVRLGEAGELQISGHYVARYLEDAGPGDLIPYPESPEKDYWLPTGDVFRKLDNGYYRIVDRIKDIYKNNRGQTIAPLKVESRFNGVPGIRKTFLVGDGRPYNVLFIVPDPGDAVLKRALVAENEREYYRRIVSAANMDLAPYERVINFALLDRDFDRGLGEITAKGSYNRKRIELDFEAQIEGLYRTSFNEFLKDGLRVRVPLWFYRDLGILEEDLSAAAEGLIDRNRALVLPIRKAPDPETWQVGDLEYEIRGGVLDLGLFARQPRLWIGNPSLVRFSPCKEGWDVPLNAVSDRVFLPYPEAARYTAAELAQPALDKAGRLAGLSRLVSEASFGDIDTAAAALEEIEGLFSRPELGTTPVIRRRLEALARHPEERIRCGAYRILLLDEPNPEYSKALSSFVQSGLSFLNEESIEIIASSRLGQGRFDALRQRMCAYREQLNWPVGEVPRLQFERILRLLVDFCRYHPEFFGSVRSELASWALHRVQPELAARADAFLEELDRDSPGDSGRIEEPGSGTWGPLLAFDEGIGPGESNEITAALDAGRFLETSVALACDGGLADRGSVAGGGVWISRLPRPDFRRSYRIGINSSDGRHYDLQLILDDYMGTEAFRETALWHMAVAGYPYGRRVLPPMGCLRPASRAASFFYAGDLNIWEKLRQFAGHRGTEGPPPPPGLLRKLFVEALSAFFRGWDYSSRRIVPGLVSPANVIVPELDYREEPMISSLDGWKPCPNALALVRPMVVNFFHKTEAYYPWCRGLLSLDWICDACYEALGYKGAVEFLTGLRENLAAEPSPGPGDAGLAATVVSYLHDLETGYIMPLPALNAIDRFKDWEIQNVLARAADRESVVLDVTRIYRLERYPEVARYSVYRHTYFAGAEPKTAAVFDRLLAKMSASIDTPAVQFIELSDLQASLRKDEDRMVFSRMVFPRLKGGGPLNILKFGDGRARRIVVNSLITDNRGAVYTFGESDDPAEIGRLYRLFFKENYPKKISEQDRHYVLKDAQERVMGGLCFRMLYGNVSYIDVLAVDSSVKAGGIGGAMLDDFCGRMAGSGVNIVLTHSYLPAFFLRRGFKADKRWGALVRYL